MSEIPVDSQPKQSEPNPQPRDSHFKNKEVIDHVAEAKAQGIVSLSEIHDIEVPGYLSAAADAARETSLVLLLIWGALFKFSIPFSTLFHILVVFSMAWSFWKCGRSAWLGWSRLERLHRIVAQEKWEIEHHRQQEREELAVLYGAKGFEGKLLEDVVDVLMADGDRLLRVMVEEELGLSLESCEHPLKQAFGALMGCLIVSLLIVIVFLFFPNNGILAIAFIAIALGAALSAYCAGNRLISAIVWNVGLAALAYGSLYFLIDYLAGQG